MINYEGRNTPDLKKELENAKKQRIYEELHKIENWQPNISLIAKKTGTSRITIRGFFQKMEFVGDFSVGWKERHTKVKE